MNLLIDPVYPEKGKRKTTRERDRKREWEREIKTQRKKKIATKEQNIFPRSKECHRVRLRPKCIHDIHHKETEYIKACHQKKSD